MRISSKTKDYIKWNRIVASVEARTSTPYGLEHVPLLAFIDDSAKAQAELQAVAGVAHLVDLRDGPPLNGLEEVRPLLDRAAKEGILLPVELNVLAAALDVVTRVGRWLGLHKAEVERLADISSRVGQFGSHVASVRSVIDPEGRIRDDASPELFSLRQKAFVLHQSIRTRLEQYLVDPDTQDLLQERFYTLREDRYVLPIKAERRSVVAGIVHDVSQSGATVFLEPEFLVPVNNGLKWAQEAVTREEQRLLREMSELIRDDADAIRRSLKAIGELDHLTAKARLASEMRGNVVELTGSMRLELRSARAPILLLQGRTVVANDISLGGGHNVMVLSGPNAGGKSVLLGTAGQCVAMAWAGLLPPVGPDSVIPQVEAIHAIPGDLEDVDNKLSTFTGHLQELNNVVPRVGPRHLVLIDEITVGTEPEQGAALGAAYLLELADRGCLTIVATHYERLKAIALSDDRMVNGAMGMAPETLAQTFKLHVGTPGSSRTIEIAQRAGTPQKILERAREIMAGEAVGRLEDAINRLQARHEALASKEAEIQARLLEAEQLKRRHSLALADIDKQAERLVEKKTVDAVRKLDEALERVARLVLEAERNTNNTAELKVVRRQVGQAVADVKKEQDARSGLREEATLNTKDVATLTQGMEVWVRKYRKKARILEIDSREGVASLSMGLMRLRLPLEELVPVDGQADQSEPKARPPVREPSTVPQRIDLRGFTTDEALDAITRTLDAASLNPPGPMTFIHGHGTGALKHAARQLFKTSRYEITFRPGKREEGGDGVTVVEFTD